MYERDESGLRDAQTELKKSQDDIAIAALEKQIKLIDEEIEKLEEQKEALEKQQKALQKQQEAIRKAMEATSKYYDKLIKDQERMFDEMIEKLEETKRKWEELAEIDQIAKAWALVEEEMGRLGYTVEDVLNDVPGAFDAFKTQYISALAEMNKNDEHYLNGLKQVTGQIPAEFDKVIDAVNKTEEPIQKVGDAAEGASGKVSNFGTSASGASTGAKALKDSTDGLAENLNEIDDVEISGLQEKLQKISDEITNIMNLIGTAGIPNSLFGYFEGLNNIVLDDLVNKFMALQTVISSVVSMLGGDGSGGAGVAEGAVMGVTAGAAGFTGGSGESEGGGGGLIGALQQVKDVATETIGTGGESSEGSDSGELSTESDGTVVGDFNALNGSIAKATTAIGTTESETDSEDLIGSIRSLGEVDTEVLQGGDSGAGVISDWQEFNIELTEAEDHITRMAEGLNNLADSYETTLTVNLVINGDAEYSGTATLGGKSGEWSFNVLKAIGLPSESGEWPSELSRNAKGTAKIPARFAGEWGYKGGKTLIAELGPELVVFPDGHAQTFDRPQIVDLPKGSVIFNHLQTNDILDPNNQIKPGSVHASGSALPLGFSHLDSDPRYDKLKSMLDDVGFPTVDAIRGVMQAQTEAIKTEVRNAVNNFSPTTTVNQNNTFKIVGVSGEEVAQKINSTLMQTFSGMSLNAYQRSMAQ